MSERVEKVGRGVRAGGLERRGSAATLVAAGLVITAVAVGLAWYFLVDSDTDVANQPVLEQVTRGPYEHVAIEQGEIESGNNVEVCCEIRAQVSRSAATAIIDVIPDGSWVKKGDWLITFDSANLEQLQRKQKIAANSREAIMIEAKATLDTAVYARQEYLEGTYKEEEKAAQNLVFLAQEGLKKAQLSYDSTKRLVSRGLLSELQLEGEKFRVDAANNDLALAQRKLVALEQFTKVKMLTKLDSDIRAAEVKYRNEQANFQEELHKLRDIEEQIAKCRVVAPADGQVVYANIVDHHGSSEFVVEPGAMVRERQVLIRLPDPRNMQVKATINESRIRLVRAGMPVTVAVGAVGLDSLRGEVVEVKTYAEPAAYWSGTAKDYFAYVRILDPPPELRVGLTAEVQIHVASRSDALQIPAEAVYERNGRTFCLVKSARGWDTRQIAVSSADEKTVAIDEERSDVLRPGEFVVANPRRHLDKFTFADTSVWSTL